MKDIGIIDIEASGLHFDSYPVEIAVLINGEKKSWLIQPEPNWNYWCKTAERIHGITQEELHAKGLRSEKVAKELNDFLSASNGVLYSDAAHWDTDWVDTLYHVTTEPRQFHIASIYDLLENDQIAIFNDRKNQLAMSGKYRQHRAEEDVDMIYEALQIALI